MVGVRRVRKGCIRACFSLTRSLHDRQVPRKPRPLGRGASLPYLVLSDKKRPLVLVLEDKDEGPVPVYGRHDSKEGKIFLQFELGDVNSVLVPLDLLVGDKLIEDMIPQSFFHQFASFRVSNCVV